MALRVLIWNLKHGRAVPSAGRDLLDEFANAMAGWEWELALLQEVPPWWPPLLGPRLDAQQRLVLTSRNGLLPLRRALAVRWPDLIKSNGGGANAILSRDQPIVEHRAQRLCWLPERRWVHGVLLANGMWACNLHTTSSVEQGRRAALIARQWANDVPVILGGDFNVLDLALEGFALLGRHGADQLFARGFWPGGEREVLDHGHLSDHAPVLVRVDEGRRDPGIAGIS